MSSSVPIGKPGMLRYCESLSFFPEDLKEVGASRRFILEAYPQAFDRARCRTRLSAPEETPAAL